MDPRFTFKQHHTYFEDDERKNIFIPNMNTKEKCHPKHELFAVRIEFGIHALIIYYMIFVLLGNKS